MAVVATLFKWLGPHVGLDFPNEAFLGVASYVISRGIAKFGKVPVSV